MGLRGELADLGKDCPVFIASDNQGVLDHSRRSGYSGATKHVGLKGLWLQEAVGDGRLQLEKVHTSRNASDVLTKALPFEQIRLLCGLAGVYFDEDLVALERQAASHGGRGDVAEAYVR